MKYDIKYGSAFASDQFGFVWRGSISINDDVVELSGPRHWPALKKFGAFITTAFLIAIFIGIGFGMVLAWLIVRYSCISPDSVSFQKSNFAGVPHL